MTLIAILILVQTSSVDSRKVIVEPASMHVALAKAPPESFAESAINSTSLLRVANSKSFRSSNWTGRVERIQRWIRRNSIKQFRELELKDRDLALRRIAKQLDNLLAEKDFRLPMVRSSD